MQIEKRKRDREEEDEGRRKAGESHLSELGVEIEKFAKPARHLPRLAVCTDLKHIFRVACKERVGKGS